MKSIERDKIDIFNILEIAVFAITIEIYHKSFIYITKLAVSE